MAEIRAGLGLDEKKSGVNGYEVESVCLYCLGMLQGPYPDPFHWIASFLADAM